MLLRLNFYWPENKLTTNTIMANKKRMYKKGSFPGMEPYKMLTFGGMKKGKYEAAGPVARQMEEAKKAKAAAERIEAEEATKAAAAKRGPSRQEKQNTPQGTGGGQNLK